MDGFVMHMFLHLYIYILTNSYAFRLRISCVYIIIIVIIIIIIIIIIDGPRSGSQSEHRMHFIFPAGGFSYIAKQVISGL